MQLVNMQFVNMQFVNMQFANMADQNMVADWGLYLENMQSATQFFHCNHSQSFILFQHCHEYLSTGTNSI